MPIEPRIVVPPHVAITSLRSPFMPIGGPHIMTSTTALASYATYEHARDEWGNTAAIRVGDIADGANVALAFIVHALNGSDANNLVASARVWIAMKAGSGVANSNPGAKPRANRLAVPVLDLAITAGNLAVDVSVDNPDDLFQMPVPVNAASRKFADTISAAAGDWTLNGAKVVGPSAADGLVMLVFDRANADKIIVNTVVNDGGTNTARGITCLMATF
jgi:hypothetical protein